MTPGACLRLAAILVALGLGATALTHGQERYSLDPSWPDYPTDMTFEMGTGIAVDADGVIYTISRDVDHWAAHPLAMTRYRGRGTIARWDRDGRFLGTFAEDQAFIGPHSMYVDGEGFIWVADREGHQIVKLTPDGEPVLTLGEYGVHGDDETHFNGPTGVAFLPDGRVVVSDGYWNSRLVWFDADGTYLKEVGELGNGPGQLGAAHAVALGPDGRLYVANVCGTNLHEYVTKPGQIAPERHEPIPGCQSRFDVFTQEGDYLGPWEAIPEPGLPLSVAAYGDRLYAGVTGSRRGRQDLIVVDAETQQVVDRLQEANVYVHQMAMAPNGDVYVASVYPEHGGEARGIEGPSFVRWARRTPSAAPATDPVPRAPDGRPDLQGVWHFNTTTPLQRPTLLGDRTHDTEEEYAAVAARASEARP